MDDGIYVAYVGKEITLDEIKNEMQKISSDLTEDSYKFYKTKIYTKSNAVFGQINDEGYDEEYKFPHSYDGEIVYVSDGEQINYFGEKFQSKYDLRAYHEILFALLKDYGDATFKMLQKNAVNCSYVIYDEKKHELTAIKIGSDTNLFFGYTKKTHEIVFSTSTEIIRNICGSVERFPDNSYYKNGKFHQLADEKSDEFFGKKDEGSSKKESLFNDSLNKQQFLNILNEILLDISDSNLQAKIEKIINDYFTSLENQKRVLDFVDKEVEIDIKRRLLEMIKSEIENFCISEHVVSELNNKYKELLDKMITQQPIPKINIIKLNDIELGRTNAELFHEKFEEVLSLVQLDEPVMLIGPAGSGKNHSISQIARALGLHMYYTNNASNEFKLTGFIDAGGNYRDTEFYKAFKNGGIFFLDEIDNSDPSALIIINSALANGYMAFPHETIDRHPDFRMVAAANTWGKGSDLQYVGRNALDGATLDRFDNVFFDYDRNLEKGLYPSEQVLRFMWSFRDAVETTKIPHIISTRGIGKVYKKEINGIPTETILRVNVIRNLGQDDLNTILGNMQNIGSSNKYYETAKTLKLVKKRQFRDDYDTDTLLF